MQWSRLSNEDTEEERGRVTTTELPPPPPSASSSPTSDSASPVELLPRFSIQRSRAHKHVLLNADEPDDRTDDRIDSALPEADTTTISLHRFVLIPPSPRSQRCCDGWVGRFSSLIPRAQAWSLLKLAAPNGLGLLISFMLNTINLAFIGHLGDSDALAGAALGNSLMNLTGYAVIIGICSSIDTLCAQAFGAGQGRVAGLVARRAAVAFTLVLFPILVIWLNAERILLLTGQDAAIASIAGDYVQWASPTIFFELYCECITRFLQAQSITIPQIFIAFFANGIHGILCWILMYQMEMGLHGAPLALMCAWASRLLMLLLYLRCINRSMYDQTCAGGTGVEVAQEEEEEVQEGVGSININSNSSSGSGNNGGRKTTLQVGFIHSEGFKSLFRGWKQLFIL